VGEALAAALGKRGGAPTAWIGEGAPVDGARAACGEAAPVADWKKAGIAGLVVSGSAACARDAVQATAGSGLRLAFGLDAAEAARPGALVATAGLFPVVEARAPASAPRDKAPLTRRSPPPPDPAPATDGPRGWWSALGRDAGVLAWASLRDLPAKGTEDPAEVRARRASVAAALAAAEAALWTTEARGFAGGRVVARAVGVREAR
jgi:hypothetical protein